MTDVLPMFSVTELSSQSSPHDGAGAASSSVHDNSETDLDFHHKRGLGTNVSTVEIKMVSPYYCMSITN